MSNTSITLLFITIALIIIATLLEFPFTGNGSAVLFVAGLAYSYVVAKNEMALLTYARSNPDQGEAPSSKPARAIPTGYPAE